MGILTNYLTKVKGKVKKSPPRHEDTKKWISEARIFNGFASGLLFLCALVSLWLLNFCLSFDKFYLIKDLCRILTGHTGYS
jgi:hypothetical protein